MTVELLKIVKKSPLEHYKNCFLNLALPVMVFSEPGPVERTKITEGLYYTIWDKWEVHGNKDFTLQDFINYFLVRNRYYYGYHTLIWKILVTEPSVHMHHAFEIRSLTTSRLLIVCKTSRHSWKHSYFERSWFNYMDHKICPMTILYKKVFDHYRWKGPYIKCQLFNYSKIWGEIFI